MGPNPIRLVSLWEKEIRTQVQRDDHVMLGKRWPSTSQAERSKRSQPCCSGQCGSVGWASSRRVRGNWFGSQWEHMPGMQVQSLFGAHVGSRRSVFLSHQCFSASLSPSLVLSLKINKWNFFFLIQPCQYVDLGLLDSRTVVKYIFVVYTAQFMVHCHGSPSKLMKY